MVSLASLWLPILLSAIIVFVASSIIHMALPYHRSDLRPVPGEEAALDAIRRLNLAPGDYGMPRPSSMADMRSPEFVERMTRGPLVLMTVSPGAPPSMTRSLALWFCYSVVVSLFGGYIASRALPAGAHYLDVFRFVGTMAFASYSLGLAQHSIWYRRNWGTTFKSMFDGLVYACLTAGTFGWLWPR